MVGVDARHCYWSKGQEGAGAAGNRKVWAMPHKASGPSLQPADFDQDPATSSLIAYGNFSGAGL